MFVYIINLNHNAAVRIINTAYFKVINAKIPCKDNNFVSSPKCPYQLWIPHNILVNGRRELFPLGKRPRHVAERLPIQVSR